MPVSGLAEDDPLTAALTAVERLVLTTDNLEDWRKYILPDAADLAWERIDWLPSFRDGIVQADAQRKPLLLWVMNGHPLGCT